MSTIARHVATDTIRATMRKRAQENRRRAFLRFRSVWAARFNRHESVLIGLSSVAFVIGCAFAPALVSFLIGLI